MSKYMSVFIHSCYNINFGCINLAMFVSFFIFLSCFLCSMTNNHCCPGMRLGEGTQVYPDSLFYDECSLYIPSIFRHILNGLLVFLSVCCMPGGPVVQPCLGNQTFSSKSNFVTYFINLCSHL